MRLGKPLAWPISSSQSMSNNTCKGKLEKPGLIDSALGRGGVIIRLTGHRMHSHCILVESQQGCDKSPCWARGNWSLYADDVSSYLEIVKMDLSPSDISVTPSSQPGGVCTCQLIEACRGCREGLRTFDDLPNANLCPEVATAFGCVESRGQRAMMSMASHACASDRGDGRASTDSLPL